MWIADCGFVERQKKNQQKLHGQYGHIFCLKVV